MDERHDGWDVRHASSGDRAEVLDDEVVDDVGEPCPAQPQAKDQPSPSTRILEHRSDSIQPCDDEEHARGEPDLIRRQALTAGSFSGLMNFRA